MIIVNFRLPIALSALYVRKFFTEKTREAAIKLIFDIWENFINFLQTVEWMDEKTRKEATRKAKALLIFIGHPNELTENNKLEDYYSNLDLEPDNFFANALRVKLDTDPDALKMEYLQIPVNKTDWRTHSKQCLESPSFNPPENSISK